MKKYFKICNSFFLLFSVFVACYRISASNRILEDQNKYTVINQSEVIYEPEDVDEKANINRKKIAHINGRSCRESEVKILLKITLHRSGKVTYVEVIESSSCQSFQDNAIKEARKIKFTPAKKNGIAVSQYQKIGFEYTLTDNTK